MPLVLAMIIIFGIGQKSMAWRQERLWDAIEVKRDRVVILG